MFCTNIAYEYYLISLLNFINYVGLFLLGFGSPYVGKTFQVLVIYLHQGNRLEGTGARASFYVFAILIFVQAKGFNCIGSKSSFVVTKYWLGKLQALRAFLICSTSILFMYFTTYVIDSRPDLWMYTRICYSFVNSIGFNER